MSCSSSTGCRTAAARLRPTSRAKPGSGLGSRWICSAASRKLIKAPAALVRLGLGAASPRRCGRRTGGRSCKSDRALAGLEDQRHLDADVDVAPARVQRAELVDVWCGGLVAAPVEPQHPVVVEREDLGLAAAHRAVRSRPMPNCGQQRRPRRGMIIDDPSRPGAARGRPAGRPGARSSWLMAVRGRSATSSSWATALTGPFGVSMCTSASRRRRCSGPWVIRPTGSWRAGRRRGCGSASRSR